MAVTVDKDRLTRDVLSLDAQANATTAQSSDIDTAASEAETKVNRYAIFFVDDTAAPSYWAEWAQAEAAFILARSWRRDAIGEFVAARDRARDDAWDHVSATAHAANLPTNAISVNGVRKYVTIACAKQQKRLFPDLHAIDMSLQEVLTELWNRHTWNNRRRQVTLTLAADVNGGGTVTLSPSVVPDKITSYRFYHQSTASVTTGPRPMEMKWATADRMAAELASQPSRTGQPEIFRIEQKGSNIVWKVFPNTDTQYVLTGEVAIPQPTLPTDPASTTEFDDYPVEWRPYIRLATLAATLEFYGHAMAARMKDKANRMMDVVIEADDRGAVNNEASVTDVYRDVESMGGLHGFGLSLGGPMD